MVCVPVAKGVVVITALPLASVAVPMVLDPSLNDTVPVGCPEPATLPESVAVNETDWPILMVPALLFIAMRVPPWLRDRLPLLFCGEALVYVPGIGIDAAFRADRDERGVAPDWKADTGLRAR